MQFKLEDHDAMELRLDILNTFSEDLNVIYQTYTYYISYYKN